MHKFMKHLVRQKHAQSKNDWFYEDQFMKHGNEKWWEDVKTSNSNKTFSPVWLPESSATLCHPQHQLCDRVKKIQVLSSVYWETESNV